MMSHDQGPSRNVSTLLAVVCGKSPGCSQQQIDGKPRYPFPELASSGRLEVCVLTNPSIEAFHGALQLVDPSIVYLQGELIKSGEEVGSLRWGDVDFSTSDALCGAFGSFLPATVYLEIPNGENLARALYSKGVPYVIYWKGVFSSYAASHFRQALFSVVQSSCCHTFNAFQVAHASFRLYRVRNDKVLASSGQKATSKCGAYLLGEPPKTDVSSPEEEMKDEEGSGSLPAIKIYDEYISMRFLVCGPPRTLDACLLGPLVDGLNALLIIELRGSKLYDRTSAPPPPLQAGTFSRAVVTMRCELSTCSSAHLSLLVSGSADTCFNDQRLENHIKKEIIKNSQLVHADPSSEETDLVLSEPIKSMSIACGASVFEVSLKVPTWACQVLRQLALDASYRSLVMLGIGSIQGLSVASFEKEDAERLLFFCTMEEKDANVPVTTIPPSWLTLVVPSRKRSEACRETKSLKSNGNQTRGNFCHKVSISGIRPNPHTQRRNTFAASCESEMYKRDQAKPSLAVVPAKHGSAGAAPATNRKVLSSTHQAQPIISLNSLPLKKHDCGRASILACSEEEFLRDVMNFLILRGHNRLVPQGGLAEFPEAILNANRLDLFNLYREVVSRGGFHVGNGINWKGQVFSKMRNHTLTNRMTGVGNTLKRHYETYLLEYELAHDDVDGECCLLCHSGAAGDWVNCRICGEWVHFICDRRQGLGAFKDYAKTDGLDYICPRCSVTNSKKKTQKTSNGY